MRDSRGLALNAHGPVAVADTGNNRVQLFTMHGKLRSVWANQGWRGPRDVAIDNTGTVYVADTGNNRVVELSPGGRILRLWH